MIKLRQIDEYRWEIPREGKMRTRGLIFASKEMIPKIMEERAWSRWPTSPPCRASSAPPWPCRTSTGATASPSAGWRPSRWRMASSPPAGWATTSTAGCACCARNLSGRDVEGRIEDLVNAAFQQHPCGVGSRRKDLKLDHAHLEEVLRQGAGWAVKQGLRQRLPTWSTSRPRAD